MSSIRNRRLALELNTTDAAKRAEISKSSWSDIENGHNRNPTVQTAYRIARVLGTTLEELFVRTNKPY